MSRKKFSLHAGLLIVMAIITYIPVIKADFVSIDDPLLITGNKQLFDTEGLKAIWANPRAQPMYCPVVTTAFWIQYHMWGLKPQGYHLVNVLFHGLSAVLLFMILMRLCVPGAWLASAVFLIHPLQVESLAWVAELKNVLSGFLSLASVWTFLKFNPPDSDRSERGPIRYYTITLFLFVGALLSKPTASTMAPVLLLVYWWKRGRFILRDTLYIAPMFVLGLITGAIAIWVENPMIIAEGANAADLASGGVGINFSIIERCLIAGRAIWFYAIKLLWPVNLTVFYTRWRIDATTWGQYLYTITAIASVSALWRLRRRIGRGPIVAVLIFAGTIAPLSGLVINSYMRISFVADHFQYMACIGLIALASASGVTLFRRLGLKFKWLEHALGALVILSLASLSWRQGNFYKRSENLFTHFMEICPDSPVAQNNMGLISYQKGELDKAISYYGGAIRLWPGFAGAHYNIGLAFQRKGEWDEATSHFYEAVRLNSKNPYAQSSLGLGLFKQGKYDEAIPHFYEALRLNPDDAKAHINLAYIFIRQGKFDEAIAHFSAALAIDPGNANVHYNLGLLFLQKGDSEKAIMEFKTALGIDPNYTKASEILKLVVEKATAPSTPH